MGQAGSSQLMVVPGCGHSENSSVEKLTDISVFSNPDLILFQKNKNIWGSSALSTGGLTFYYVQIWTNKWNSCKLQIICFLKNKSLVFWQHRVHPTVFRRGNYIPGSSWIRVTFLSNINYEWMKYCLLIYEILNVLKRLCWSGTFRCILLRWSS